MRAKPEERPPPNHQNGESSKLPKAIWKPKRIMHLSSATLYFLARMLLSSSLDTEARLGWIISIVYPVRAKSLKLPSGGASGEGFS